MILPLERDAFHGTVQVEMKNQTFRRLANLVISPGSFEKKNGGSYNYIRYIFFISTAPRPNKRK